MQSHDHLLFLLPDVSSFQMNDSSYDSLENELNDDPESPYQEQLPLRDKPDSRSRDSVITLSDCEPDPDPETETDLLLQLPPLARPRRFSPAVRQPRTRQANGLSQGPRRLRRSSEPALALSTTPPSATVTAHADQHRVPTRKASFDAAMEGEGEEEEEDEVFLEQRLSRLQLKEERDACEKGGAKVQNGGRRKVKQTPPPPLRLDASCSSLSSPATSPTGSSLSSLDSAFSQYSTDYTSNGMIPLAEPPGRPQLSPRGSPPQPHLTQSSQPPRTIQPPSHGVHPNTWLKKDRRLSLRQSTNGQAEEDLTVVNSKANTNNNGSSVGSQEVVMTNRLSQRRSSSPPSYQQAMLQLQRGHSPFYRGTEKPLTVRELRVLQDQTGTHRLLKNSKSHTGEFTQRLAGECVQPPQGVFYGQSTTTLVLKRQMSHSPPLADGYQGSRTLPRRASAPTKIDFATLTSKPSASRTLDRPRACKAPPRNGDLRVSDVEPNHSLFSASPRVCLSSSATETVRDYFTTQEQVDASLRRGQQVSLASVQGTSEWQNQQCSDSRVDEFDQMLFAEESYV